MTTTTDTAPKRETHFKEGWWRRKAIYVLLAAGFLVAAGMGWITQEQAAEWTDRLANVIPELLGAAGFSFVAGKVHSGSDSTATFANVEATAANAAAAARREAEGLLEDQRKKFETTIRGLYEAPYGRHESVPPAPEPEITSVKEFYNRGRQ